MTFTIESKATGAYIADTVTTDRSTVYQAGACTDIQTSVNMDVTGPRQADGSVKAVAIRFTSPQST